MVGTTKADGTPSRNHRVRRHLVSSACTVCKYISRVLHARHIGIHGHGSTIEYISYQSIRSSPRKPNQYNRLRRHERHRDPKEMHMRHWSLRHGDVAPISSSSQDHRQKGHENTVHRQTCRGYNRRGTSTKIVMLQNAIVKETLTLVRNKNQARQCQKCTWKVQSDSKRRNFMNDRRGGVFLTVSGQCETNRNGG